MIFLIVTSITSVAEAVCLAGTCASLTESLSSGVAKTLLQRTTRADPDETPNTEDEDVKMSVAHPITLLGADSGLSEHVDVSNRSVTLQGHRGPADNMTVVSPHMVRLKSHDMYLKRLRKQQGNSSDPAQHEALIDRTHHLIMGWSARAACTAAINMFFESAGMYTEEDQQSFPWVHDYREDMGDDIMPRKSDMDNPEYLKFKIVRNPFSRAISNWNHQMHTNFSYRQRIQDIAHENGVDTNVSFVDWLKFVKKVGLDVLDEHSQPQYSSWERKGGKYNMILQLEAPNFLEQLEKINSAYGSKLNFKTMHVSLVSASTGELIRQHTPEGPTTVAIVNPTASKIYENAEAVDLVQQIYVDDFNAYGYSKDPKAI